MENKKRNGEKRKEFDDYLEEQNKPIERDIRRRSYRDGKKKRKEVESWKCQISAKVASTKIEFDCVQCEGSNLSKNFQLLQKS